ncbi:hypothetical protein V5740_00765 [Croceibacterium sp. TMG7-5b_MA50]|uniref:hypothetical protein n=1 Tax=Croceibacterium sp. TMG7-5b_MA50 TaxID=3121290 RepID=UPI0032219F0A
MTQWIEANWLLVVIALVVAVLVLLWIRAANRRTRVDLARDPAEAEAPARRNQALIDAPPAAAAMSELPPAAPAGMAGVGEAVIAGAAITPPPPDMIPTAVEAPATESELLRIKGLGPKLVDQLHALGITRLDQIAAWDDAEIDRVDAQLGRFQGRIRRDDWPAQARLLAAGNITGYEERFGRV